MSYRRKKEASIDKRHYEDFLRRNADLIARIGIPVFITDDYNHWLYYLDHGAPYQDAPMQFQVEYSDTEHYNLLKLLIESYVQTGFDVSRGWCCLAYADIEVLARRYGH